MSTSVVAEKSQNTWATPEAKPLDEAVWRAWLLRGVAEEARSKAAVIKVVKCIAIAGLLLAAALWSRVAPIEVVVRFVAAVSAIVVMSEAFRTRHYAAAGVFGALVILYNPIAPLFQFSGEWARALVAVTALPFVASVARETSRTAAGNV